MNQSEKLYGGQQVKELDTLAIEQYKIPAIELMGRAAAACFKVVRQGWPLAKKFAVICGHGNNGGDGFALATMLHHDNFQVEVYTTGDSDAKISPTAQIARAEFLKTGLKIKPLPERLEHVDLIIDALLGTGLRAPLAPAFAKAIHLMNQSERPVFSIDIPSGIDGNTGAVVDMAVKADLTLTFIGMKYALLTGVAKNYTGHILFDSLGIPEEVYAAKSWQGEILDLNRCLWPLKPRLPASHKGHFGHVLIVGAGSPGFSGAVGLAGLASLNAGSGLTSAIIHPDSLTSMAKYPLEMMCHPDDNGSDEVWDKATVIVIGPGLTRSKWAQTQWTKALSKNLPMVVDADALQLLAKSPQKREDWILTPHPGEAAALLDSTVLAVESNRVEAVRALQAKYGGVVVLKGSGTLICGFEPHFFLCQQGNPGMATGGMGDVLSGLIGALLAQGLNNLDAAKLAVMIHAHAGDLERSMGERGMLASELMLHIRSLINPQYNSEQSSHVSQFFDL